MTLYLEIRPGEGGDDAKELVAEQARIYLRYAARTGLAAEMVDNSKG